jgi:DNA repair photolyase
VVGKYRLSPYMACEHGCLYCDGRAERYWVEGEFDRDIVVRTNLPELLEKDLARQREKGFVTVGSGITDGYQPTEAAEQIMARCAAVLAESSFPVTVLTKSALVVRDLPLWKKVNERSAFMLVVSLMFTEDRERRIFEPRAASVEKRLEMLRVFKEAGCHTGVLAMPVLPGITDSKEALTRLYRKLQQIEVDWIMPGGLTLRPGRQKDTYMGLISRNYPGLEARYRRLYSEERASGSPLKSYLGELGEKFRGVSTEFGISPVVPHSIYRDQLHNYDELNVLLHQMMELYGSRGVNTAPLRAATKRYMSWLQERKLQYNRHRSWRYEDLEVELREKCVSGALADLLGNQKLAAFAHEILVQGKTFDSVSLSCR